MIYQFANDECRSCDTLTESCQNYEATLALCPAEATTEETTEATGLDAVSDFVLGTTIVAISTTIIFILLIRGD